MVYFNYQRSIFRTIRRFFKKLVSKILNISYKKVTIILFIVSIILTFLHNTSQASSVNINSVDDQTEAYYSWDILKDRQLNYQRALVLFSINPFLKKTPLWDFLKTNIYDKWYQANTAIEEIFYDNLNDNYLIRAYTDLRWKGTVNYTTVNNNGKVYEAGYYDYTGKLVYISYDPSNNKSVTRLLKDQDVQLWCAYFSPTNKDIVVTDDSVVDFIKYINSSSADYSSLLDNINNSLTNIDTSLVNVSSLITSVNNSLNTIIEKLDNKTDYSGQISDIRDSLDNLAQQQQQTQDTIKDESQAIQNSIDSSTNEITNTLTDNDVSDIEVDEFEDIATNVTDDPTANGFNNIFDTIRNALVNENTEPLKITIPFTDKSFEISASTVYGNFSGFDTIKNLASVVWYFIISLFIVKDIAKRINKIKSGNIDDVCDSNIKEDIL